MSHAFVFIGRSGCGKGTQADLLLNFLKEKGIAPALYVETGDLFRDFIQGESFAQRRSKEFYESSIRQPDFLACHMWSHLLLTSFKEGMTVVLDGTPRSLSEAQVLKSAFPFFNFEKKFIIHLNVSREWSRERLLLRGRSDDQAGDKIEKRLNWYEKDVVPAIEYFRNDPEVTFLDINGEQEIDAVYNDIVRGIGSLS